jgi:Tfp pilus assembly protein PilX
MSARGARFACASDQQGLALIAVLLWTALITVLASAIVLVTTVETTISARHRDGLDALYAADAALEIAVGQLAAVANWDLVLNGTSRSTSSDGGPTGTRPVPDGTSIDLDKLTAMLRCGKESACSDADMNTVTADRPWGISSPRWQLFLCGSLGSIAGLIDGATRAYVLVWVADDPSDNDGDPLRDNGAADNPGRGRILVTAQAYGTSGARRTIQATVVRAGAAIRMVTWREVI